MHNAYKERYEGPPISLPEEDKDEGLPGGVGRPLGMADPGLQRVQVHLEEESWPRHLITFHICVGGKLTSK